MDTKILKKKFLEEKWYRQGSAAKLLYIGYPLQACSHFTVNHKQTGLYYKNYFAYFEGDFMYYYFTEAIAEKIAKYYWAKENDSPGSAGRRYQRWMNGDGKKLRKMINEIENQDFKKIGQRNFLKIFIAFSKIYEETWREAIFLDAFDIMSNRLLDSSLQKDKIQLTEDEKHILTAPRTLSWLQREKVELFRLLRISSKSQLGPALRKHAKKWHWILNDYHSIKNLDAEYFEKQLRHYRKNLKTLHNEKQATSEISENQAKCRWLLKKKRLSKETLRLSEFLRVLSAWRDSRKAFNQMAGNAIKKFANEFSRRFQLPAGFWENLFFWEIEEIIFSAPSLSKAISAFQKNRKHGFLIRNISRNAFDSYYGNVSRGIKRQLDTLIGKSAGLKGQVAFSGVVRGKAKIILSQKDFYKMKKGDILVAPNTRPEYVPIMKIAGAIISEEGGITCHSAIVSRELKKPCIVSVQGACDRLRDGDLVEVDANKGIVKKLR